MMDMKSVLSLSSSMNSKGNLTRKAELRDRDEAGVALVELRWTWKEELGDIDETSVVIV